jgi:hypothetical protein
VLQFGACGLRMCGHNVWWGGLSTFTKLIWAYYFFNWAIIFLALAICKSTRHTKGRVHRGLSPSSLTLLLSLPPSLFPFRYTDFYRL